MPIYDVKQSFGQFLNWSFYTRPDVDRANQFASLPARIHRKFYRFYRIIYVTKISRVIRAYNYEWIRSFQHSGKKLRNYVRIRIPWPIEIMGPKDQRFKFICLRVMNDQHFSKYINCGIRPARVIGIFDYQRNILRSWNWNIAKSLQASGICFARLSKS